MSKFIDNVLLQEMKHEDDAEINELLNDDSGDLIDIFIDENAFSGLLTDDD